MTADAAIAANLASVRARIAAAAAAAARDPSAVTLVAVTKTFAAEAVAAALVAGQAVFGENRVQEAKAKYPALKAAHPELKLHLIGPLQTNKVRDAVALFDVIETIDRAKLARAVAEESKRAARRPSCFVQVNIGEEQQKAGVAPAEAEALIALARDELGLDLVGLMCIPPADQDPTPHFRRLAEMAQRHRLPQLSMGMSGDFEIAIRCGATHVRVGSAIFGGRP